MMRPAHALLAVLLALAAILACGSDPAEPRTQITIRLYASPEVRDALSAVQVRAVVDGREGPQSSRVVAKGDIPKWPVDVAVVSSVNNDVSEAIEVIAAALGSDGRPLAEQRRFTSSVPGEQRVLELTLARCGDRALGNVCETNAACRGAACKACVDGLCTTPLRTPGLELPPLNATEVPADKDPAGGTRMDAGIDAGPGVPSADGGSATSCADQYYWQPVTSMGALPPGIQPFARPSFTATGNMAEPGIHDQYICRVKDADGYYLHGKVNATWTGTFNWGCYFARFDATMGPTGKWVPGSVDTPGVPFEVLVPPAGCTLSWVQSQASLPLPKNALIITNDKNWRRYYACRVEMNEPESTGPHIGRVSEGFGDRCRLQFYDNEVVFESEKFEVLVQEAPQLPY